MSNGHVAVLREQGVNMIPDFKQWKDEVALQDEKLCCRRKRLNNVFNAQIKTKLCSMSRNTTAAIGRLCGRWIL